MTTVAPSSNGEDSLLDLHFLTEEERATIEEVLREDEEMKMRGRIRLGTLRQELERERNYQKLFIDDDHCACCEQPFGTIFNRGENCPKCFHRVCEQCRCVSYQKPPSFICTVCSKKGLLDLQSVDYMSLLLSSKLKDPPPLYGTELVLKSLGASSASGRWTPFRRPALLEKHHEVTSSMTSLSSMYSAACGKGDYDITGEVQVGVWYKDGQLFVRVVKARGLAVAKKSGHSDPYIKTYLLPDKSKHTKRKTRIQQKTTYPNYNEILKYKVPQGDLHSRTLWLSVWDWNRFGRNQFLGEVHLPLSQLDLTSPEGQYHRWYTLHEKEDSDVESLYRGRLQVGLMFSSRETQRGKRGSRTKGLLHILIKQAEDLPIMDPHGLTDGTVKCYLLPNRSSHSKKKTAVIKNNLNPIWEEQFTYDVTLEELSSERVLEVTVWDYDRRGSNDFIGALRLGPAPSTHMVKHKEWMDSIEEEVTHWKAMLSRPGEWVEEWHVLRPSMDPLGTISGYKPPLPPNKSARLPELSPVQEAILTQELTSVEGQLPTLEMYSFTPPPPPEASSTPGITQPQPVSSSSRDVPQPPPSGEVPQTPPPSNEVPRTPPSVASEEGFHRTSPAPSTPTIMVPEVVEDKPWKEHSELLKYNDDASFGSTTSIDSDGGGKGDYDITGDVLVAEGEVQPPVVQSNLESGSRGSSQKEGEARAVEVSFDPPLEHPLPSSMDPRDIDLSSCPPPEPPLPSTLVEEFPTTVSETTRQGLAEESLFGAKVTIMGNKETELLYPKVPEVLSSVAEPLPSENETTARRPKKKTTPSPPVSPAHETSKQPHPTPPPPTIEEEFHKVLTTHHQQKMISDEKSPSESSSLDAGSRGFPQREGEVWPLVVQSSLDSGYAPTEHSLPSALWESDII